MLSAFDLIVLPTLFCALAFAFLSKPQFFPNSRVENFTVNFLCWLVLGMRPVIFILLVLAVSVGAIHSFSHSPDVVRRVGWFWEVVGLVIAINGVLKLRVEHGLTSYRSQIGVWWGTRPRWHSRTSVMVASLGSVIVASDAEVSIWNPDDPELELKIRLERALRNIDYLRSQQRDIRSGVAVVSERVSKVEKDVKLSGDALRQELQERMKKLDTDGAGVALSGLLFVGFGLTLSTLTNEIATWLLWLCG